MESGFFILTNVLQKRFVMSTSQLCEEGHMLTKWKKNYYECGQCGNMDKAEGAPYHKCFIIYRYGYEEFCIYCQGFKMLKEKEQEIKMCKDTIKKMKKQIKQVEKKQCVHCHSPDLLKEIKMYKGTIKKMKEEIKKAEKEHLRIKSKMESEREFIKEMRYSVIQEKKKELESLIEDLEKELQLITPKK